MADVVALANALGANLAAANPPIRFSTFLPDSFSPPIAVISAGEVEYHKAFGTYGLGTYAFQVIYIVPRVSDRTAIESLESAMSTTGATSLIAALESDRTLGGLAVQNGVVVMKAGPITNVTFQSPGGTAIPYSAVPFDLEVYAE